MNYELEDFDYYSNQTTQMSLPPKVHPIILEHARCRYENSRKARDEFLKQLKMPIPPPAPVPSSYEELNYKAQRFEDEMLQLDKLLNKEQSENQQFEGESFGKELVLINKKLEGAPKVEGAQQDPKSPDDSVSEVGASEFQNDDDGCC